MHRAGGWICCRRPHADTHRETAITVLPQVDRSLDRMMIYTGKTHTARKMEKEKKEKLWKTCENEKEERLYVYVYIKELDHYIFHGWYSIHTHALWEYIKDCLVPSFIIHAIHLPLWFFSPFVWRNPSILMDFVLSPLISISRRLYYNNRESSPN